MFNCYKVSSLYDKSFLKVDSVNGLQKVSRLNPQNLAGLVAHPHNLALWKKRLEDWEFEVNFSHRNAASKKTTLVWGGGSVSTHAT